MPKCEHKTFKASVRVGRLTDGDGGAVTGHVADITICCARCELPFRFIGLPFGAQHHTATTSVDGLELRAPLEPAHVPEFLGKPVLSGRA
jgi:hypothetical protein